MKAVIFAGGVGTRLWPLSRKKSPKQFETLVGEKSTLQLSVERLMPEFKPEDIYISTGTQYKDLVAQQLPSIPKENIIGEPEKKDVGPAVAFMMGYLSKLFPNEAVVILWSDHLVKHEKKFKAIIQNASRLVEQKGNRIVFIGQKPRFASDNLGWIEAGEVKESLDSVQFLEFNGFKYRPDKALAEQYFKNPKYCWNLGYFVSTPLFVYSLFHRFAPKIYEIVESIVSKKNDTDFEQNFEKKYHEMPEINFDNAVLEQLDSKYAYVVMDDIGWSDVGAWEALKEALESHPDDTVTKGNVLVKETNDSLVYNYEDKKLVVCIDGEELLIINTKDVLLVAKKTSVGKVKKLVESFQGTRHEELT